MKLDRKEYRALCKEQERPSPSRRTVPAAFAVGGTLCLLGQVLRTLYQTAGLDEKAAGTAVSVTLIAVGVALTALRLFEKIAKFAGAGTLVPITGFANSIASPALEFKTEGFVLGTCVKMFSIAGPVLTWGISASVAYGLLLWLSEVMG
ncbi:MAG: SpoVA/SpoVAEb family sporulation membrane protein [Clostridia bacterium]|nr:SpoVA/SpoVAEb family sporulation membrane protein [Clostridia bacterium]